MFKLLSWSRTRLLSTEARYWFKRTLDPIRFMKNWSKKLSTKAESQSSGISLDSSPIPSAISPTISLLLLTMRLAKAEKVSSEAAIASGKWTSSSYKCLICKVTLQLISVTRKCIQSFHVIWCTANRCKAFPESKWASKSDIYLSPSAQQMGFNGALDHVFHGVTLKIYRVTPPQPQPKKNKLTWNGARPFELWHTLTSFQCLEWTSLNSGILDQLGKDSMSSIRSAQRIGYSFRQMWHVSITWGTQI